MSSFQLFNWMDEVSPSTACTADWMEGKAQVEIRKVFNQDGFYSLPRALQGVCVVRLDSLRGWTQTKETIPETPQRFFPCLQSHPPGREGKRGAASIPVSFTKKGTIQPLFVAQGTWGACGGWVVASSGALCDPFSGGRVPHLEKHWGFTHLFTLSFWYWGSRGEGRGSISKGEDDPGSWQEFANQLANWISVRKWTKCVYVSTPTVGPCQAALKNNRCGLWGCGWRTDLHSLLNTSVQPLEPACQAMREQNRHQLDKVGCDPELVASLSTAGRGPTLYIKG